MEAREPDRQIQQSPVMRKWYHLRWQVMLLVPLALLVLVGFYVPRQIHQQRAIVALKPLGAIVRTQPVALFGLELVLPQAYADEIVEVYWRDPALDDKQLAVLAGLSTIEKLELSGSQVTSEGLSRLGGLSKLYMLHLDGTQVGDDGLASLARFRSLGVLSLDNTPVTDSGLAQLKRMPQLERLYLNGTSISDAGLAHLAGLKNLKELSLVETQISDAGLIHLKGLTNLEMLKVHDTRVTPNGMNDLHVALPKCVIWVPSP